jgi:hypothetical protein
VSARTSRRVAAVAVVALAGGGLLVGALGGACPEDTGRLPEMIFAFPAEAVWEDGAVATPPPAPGEVRLLVTNNLDDTMSVVSLERLLAGGEQARTAELARVPVGIVPIEREGPHHVAVSLDGKTAWVGLSNYVPGGGSGPHGIHGAGTADGRVVAIDLLTLRTTASRPVDRNPGDVRLTPDGQALLVTHFDLVAIAEAQRAGHTSGPELDARLGVLDPVTLARREFIPLCPAPHGMAMTPDSRTAVVSCLSDEAAVVNLPTGTVTRVTLLDTPGTAARPACGPYAVTLMPDATTAQVSCYDSGDLVAVDIPSRTRGTTLTLPGRPVFGSVSAAGDLFALAVQGTDGVVFLTADPSPALVRFAPLPANICPLPHTTHFVADDTRLVVVCEGNKRDPGSVIALDVSDLAAGTPVVGSVTVGVFPDDLAVAVVP